MIMVIKVRVIPNSKHESIERLGDTEYKVKVAEKAIGGRANIAVVTALSFYFKVRKSDISIIKGATSREKVMSVAGLPDG